MTKKFSYPMLFSLIPLAFACYIGYKEVSRNIKRKSLKGQVVIITGASEGIGKELAYTFAKEGCKIVLASRSQDKLESLAKEIIEKYKVEVLVIPTDVSKETDTYNLIEKTLKKFEHIDILINNAGIATYSYFSDSDMTVLKNIMETNFWGMVYCTKAILPSMMKRGKGKIVNISSYLGKRAMPSASVYSASKFAMNGFSESLRVEVKKYGIDVCVICPTATKTELINNASDTSSIKYGVDSMAMLPERVAKETIDAILDNKREHIIGFGEKLGLILNNTVPSLMDEILERMPKNEFNKE